MNNTRPFNYNQREDSQYNRTRREHFSKHYNHNQTQRKECGSAIDERVKLYANISMGNGRYRTGIFHKKYMLNFNLNITINNPDKLKISSVTAYLYCGRNSLTKTLPNTTSSTTPINLETAQFSGNISASIIVVYKIGLFSTKQIRTTVSKFFK